MNLEVEEPKTNTQGLTQSYVLRKVAYDIVIKLATQQVSEEDLETSRVIAQSIRSWTDADDRVRIHRGKPLPGSLRPQVQPKKRTDRGKGAEAGVKEAANKPADPPAPIVLPPANEPQPVVVPDVAASK
jgi:hypothetical protein